MEVHDAHVLLGCRKQDVLDPRRAVQRERQDARRVRIERASMTHLGNPGTGEHLLDHAGDIVADMIIGLVEIDEPRVEQLFQRTIAGTSSVTGIRGFLPLDQEVVIRDREMVISDDDPCTRRALMPQLFEFI